MTSYPVPLAPGICCLIICLLAVITCGYAAPMDSIDSIKATAPKRVKPHHARIPTLVRQPHHARMPTLVRQPHHARMPTLVRQPHHARMPTLVRKPRARPIRISSVKIPAKRHRPVARHAPLFARRHSRSRKEKLLARVTVGNDGKSMYRSIGEAMLHVKEGGVIKVHKGIYRETIDITKRVTIESESARGEVLIESPQSCLEMLAQRATVRSLTLHTLSGNTNLHSYAVDIRTGNLVLENCDISSDGLACVGIHGQETVGNLEQCSIHNGSQTGVFVYAGAQVSLEDCTIADNLQGGVAVNTAAKAALHRCALLKCGKYGLSVSEGSEAVLEDCEIANSDGAGILITEAGKVTAWGTQIHGGTGKGVLLVYTGQAAFKDCSVFGNADGAIQKGSASALDLVDCDIRN